MNNHREVHFEIVLEIEYLTTELRFSFLVEMMKMKTTFFQGWVPRFYIGERDNNMITCQIDIGM
jgi:hypothetical protein